MKTIHEMAFRVNDTTITHITIETNATVQTALKMARRRLEKQGYWVNELVWNKIKTVGGN